MTPALVAATTVGAGALGTLLRYLVSVLVDTWAGAPGGPRSERRPAAEPRPGRSTRFPLAVLIVNVVGSALAGVMLGGTTDAALQLVVLTGFCGGLTTFSTFSVETIQLVLACRARVASVSVLANLVLGIGACWMAYLLCRALTG